MVETLGVAETFGIVVFAVVAAAALVAVLTVATSGRSWDQIGRGGLSLRDDGARDDARAARVAAREREDEIRQMLEARNELRRRHGREPVDVEAELRALDRPAAAADPALEAEIRALVVARNERRVRQGRAPLDVDAEVARRLRDLTGGDRA
jgi:hypothetical protein